jgi:hypothetical protein
LVLSLSLSLFPMDHSHQPSLHCTNFFIFFSLFADRASQDTWQTWQPTQRIQPSTCPRMPFTESKTLEGKRFTAFKASARHSLHICLMYFFLFLSFFLLKHQARNVTSHITWHLPALSTSLMYSLD